MVPFTTMAVLVALPLKPVPVMVTTVPPNRLPCLGYTLYTCCWYCTRGTPWASAARPLFSSNTTTSTAYEPAGVWSTVHTMYVLSPAVMLHGTPPMVTLLLPGVDANRVPLMTRVSPTVIAAGSTAVTVGVSADVYAYTQLAPNPVVLAPQDAAMPLVHTCTMGCGSMTWKKSPGMGSRNRSVDPF